MAVLCKAWVLTFIFYFFFVCFKRTKPVHRAASGPSNDPTFFDTVVLNKGVGINRQERYGWNSVWRQGVWYGEPAVGGAAAKNIMGGSVGLHPILVIILVLLGASVGGILGMLFVIPIVDILKVVLGEFISNLKK